MALARIARSGLRRGAIGCYSLQNNTFCEGVPAFKHSLPSLENVSPNGILSYLCDIRKASSLGNWSRGIRTTPHFQFQFQNGGKALSDRIPQRNFHGANTEIVRPLSPHLPIYKPQLTSTSSIFNRISGAFLSGIILFSYLELKMGSICFTYENFYQFLFYSSKLILISAEISALALFYHLYKSVGHFSMGRKLTPIKGLKRQR